MYFIHFPTSTQKTNHQINLETSSFYLTNKILFFPPLTVKENLIVKILKNKKKQNYP